MSGILRVYFVMTIEDEYAKYLLSSLTGAFHRNEVVETINNCIKP